jgi:hypothetical protein
MKTYPIPAPLLQVIVNFLQKQPWIEVNDILGGVNAVVLQTDQPQAPLSKPNGGDEARP